MILVWKVALEATDLNFKKKIERKEDVPDPGIMHPRLCPRFFKIKCEGSTFYSRRKNLCTTPNSIFNSQRFIRCRYGTFNYNDTSTNLLARINLL
jgi:hypothetical protein